MSGTQSASGVVGRSILRCAVIACMGVAATANGEIVEFTAIPTGTCAGTGSSATGLATFSLDTATGDVTYDIQLTGITPTEMHIHAPADECFLVQFAVIRFVFPPGANISGTFNANPELMGWMLGGQSWLVVHTAPFGAIEIIGHLDRQCPGDCSGHGMCLNGTCLCDSGWSGEDCTIEHVIPAVSTWGLLAMTLLLLVAATVLLRDRQTI